MSVFKKTASFLVGVGLSVFVSTSFAERTVEEVYKECGIGGALFGESSPTLAFISNVTWDLGTTAATSDSTGGCAIGGDETAAIFIHEAYDQLEKDIAVGSGEYYSSLVSLLNCDAANTQEVMNSVRSEFSKLVSLEAYTTMSKMEKSEKLYKIVSPMIADHKESACTIS